MSRTNGTELDPLVDQFAHLSSKRRADEALHILKRVASIVKPIMRMRNWRVGLLAETYPSEVGLLGLNTDRGRMIHLRLRYPGDENQFLPFENIVDTMLHELSHIVHGPHDQAFHALWDKLRDEHESLLRKGYTGEGFLGKGNQVGGRRIPRSELQRQARAAAEGRRRVAVLSGNSGSKLGGQGIRRGQDAREVIAAAAEKRNRINKGCGSAMNDLGKKAIQEEATKQEKVTTTKAEKAEEDEDALMQAYIDIIQEDEAQLVGSGYVPPSQENPIGGVQKGNRVQPPKDMRALQEEQLQIEQQLNGSRKEYEPDSKPRMGPTTSRPAGFTSNALPAPKASAAAALPRIHHTPPKLPQDEETWTCDICTLINPMAYLLCGACETERPAIYNSASTSPPSLPTSSNTSRSKSASSRSQPRNVLAPRVSASDNIARFETAARQKAQSTPAGWTCSQCSNWMESHWWTCSRCGRMKETS